jgi:hypothetical protein
MEKEFGLTPASRARLTKKAAASAPAALAPNTNPLRNPDKHAGFEQYKVGLAVMKLNNSNTKKTEEDDDD